MFSLATLRKGTRGLLRRIGKSIIPGERTNPSHFYTPSLVRTTIGSCKRRPGSEVPYSWTYLLSAASRTTFCQSMYTFPTTRAIL